MSNPRLKELLAASPIVVTGYGAWSAAGSGATALWHAALDAKGLAKEIQPANSARRYAACVAPTPEPPPDVLRRRHRMDRSVAFAAAAAWEAWCHSGLREADMPAERVAVVVGTSRGPVHAAAEAYGQLSRDRVLPSAAVHATPASLSGIVAGMIGARGPALVVSAACASSADAIATAGMLLLTGQADVVLAGGAEAPLHATVLSQLDAAGVLASHPCAALACRPFDAHRNGTVLGEGAGFLVLETLASARRRNATIHARLAGWGIRTEPGERAGIGGGNSGLVSAMRAALDAAGLAPAGISYLNTHGTGTVLNDRCEAAAIREVFGRALPLISGTKPVTGHCMGATAALESIIVIQSLAHGLVPATANNDAPDPACGIGIVREQAEHCAVDAVMTNSSGFWGNHASIIFSRPPDQE